MRRAFTFVADPLRGGSLQGYTMHLEQVRRLTQISPAGHDFAPVAGDCLHLLAGGEEVVGGGGEYFRPYLGLRMDHGRSGSFDLLLFEGGGREALHPDNWDTLAHQRGVGWERARRRGQHRRA